MNDEIRTCIVKARLTQNEYNSFLEKVQDSARPDNRSEYIRECIFSDDLKHSVAVARELKNLNYQIRKIGVLINQIAAGVNRGIVFRGDAEVIVKKQKEIENMLQDFPQKIE